jgi:hypothetical protein
MHSRFLSKMLLTLLATTCAWGQQSGSCANLANFKAENVEITKAASSGGTLTAPMVDGVNTFGTPNTVVPKPISAKVQGGKLTLMLEA